MLGLITVTVNGDAQKSQGFEDQVSIVTLMLNSFVQIYFVQIFFGK
jgi:hypothetical protein